MLPSSHNPFKSPPLRQPGQSIIQRMRQRMGREMVPAMLVMILIGFVIGLNTGLLAQRFLLPAGGMVSLIVMAVSIAIIVIPGAWVLRRLDASEVLDQQDRLGVMGERVVADALDDLKRDGYYVFHDVPPEREGEGLANFDHVVIGPTGVYVIETKTRNKNEGGGNAIVVQADGRVLVNGMQPDRCPIRQAKALRSAMKGMLERQTTMRDIFVRGVVIFPEWNIDDKAYRKTGGDVWTLHHTAFNKWVRNGKEAQRLTPDQIALLSSRVEDHARRAGASPCRT
jgi:hypothetical protein